MICAALLFIFARFFYAVADLPQNGYSAEVFFDDLLHGGIVFYGGMLGVLLGCVISGKLFKTGARRTLDWAAPAIPLFHAVARIGCLFAGCCYGFVSPWGVPNVHFDEGVLLFPVQIFESVCNLLIFIAILVAARARKSDKYSAEIYLASYAVCRFVLEFFRGDAVRGIWSLGLSTSQYLSLFILVGVAVEIIILAVRKKRKNAV